MKAGVLNSHRGDVNTADFQGCPFCLVSRAGICPGAGANSAPRTQPAAAVTISRHTIQARQMIHSAREFSGYVICFCSGQAVSSVALPDGRRQILDVLLPGDCVYWTDLFDPMSGRLIEATENSIYRKIDRKEFYGALAQRPEAFDAFIKLCVGTKDQADQLALTLGRRDALQRIARFILDLAMKLIDRGFAKEQTISFPLRLRHIADATGLTPVHTSKMLRQLRRDRVIDLEARSLRVADMIQLRQIAGP